MVLCRSLFVLILLVIVLSIHLRLPLCYLQTCLTYNLGEEEGFLFLFFVLVSVAIFHRKKYLDPKDAKKINSMVLYISTR